jgi:hypothetical protein
MVVLAVAALSLLAMPAVGMSAAEPVKLAVAGTYDGGAIAPDSTWWSADKGPPTPPMERTVRHDSGGGGSFDGDIVGDFLTNIQIIRAQFGNNGNEIWVHINANGTFTGSILGLEGTCEMKLKTVWTVPGPPPPPGSNIYVTGSLVISHGTGELENIHGVLTLAGFRGNVEYSGYIWFDGSVK